MSRHLRPPANDSLEPCTEAGELIAVQHEPADVEADYEGMRRSLYVTEQRKFLIVECFYSFDGREATSKKIVSPEQARAWCVVCGLQADIIDRYLDGTPATGHAPDAVSLLTQRWTPEAVQTSGEGPAPASQG